MSSKSYTEFLSEKDAPFMCSRSSCAVGVLSVQDHLAPPIRFIWRHRSKTRGGPKSRLCSSCRTLPTCRFVFSCEGAFLFPLHAQMARVQFTCCSATWSERETVPFCGPPVRRGRGPSPCLRNACHDETFLAGRASGTNGWRPSIVKKFPGT